MRLIKGLIRDDHGQDMVEYGLLAALLSIAALATVRLIGPLIAPLYQRVVDALS